VLIFAGQLAAKPELGLLQHFQPDQQQLGVVAASATSSSFSSSTRIVDLMALASEKGVEPGCEPLSMELSEPWLELDASVEVITILLKSEF